MFKLMESRPNLYILDGIFNVLCKFPFLINRMTLSPEGLSDKSVSLIPNTDEILKLVKQKMN